MAVDDSYTISLLHFNGTDGSGTFTDESGKTWTPTGVAQLDTAQKKFGTASGLFLGADTVDTADHADWQLDGGSDSNEWTIDFWLRFSGDPGTGTQGFIQQRQNSSNFWAFFLINNELRIHVRSAGTNIVILSNAWNPAGDTWYHVACVKQGTTGYKMFVDGTQVGTTQTDTSPMPDIAGGALIGDFFNASDVHNYLSGWIDELRVSKGIARWTANFTPPTNEYGQGPGVIFIT